MNAERISELQYTSAKTLKTETNKIYAKKKKKKKNRRAKHYEATTRSMTCVMRIPEGEKKRKKNFFEAINND